MSKIIKSFKPDVTIQDVEKGGLTNFCSWERLKPYLGEAAGCSLNEVVIGVIATDYGLEIKIKTI